MYHEASKGAGVGDGPTHSGVGEHSRILERHTEPPFKNQSLGQMSLSRRPIRDPLHLS
jgi:hypothetical protein